MSGAWVVARSTAETNLQRYARSKGLWFLLLAGLVGARFMVPRDDGTAVVIAVNGHLPAMTSAMLGTSLGIVITTLLLPLGFLYLRSNTTRRQPWQIAEVTTASRVAVALGRCIADSVVLGALLATMTMAGWFLAWFIMPAGEIHLWQIALALLLTGVPALLGLAAMRVLLDALPLTRRAWGDVVFFVFWLATIAVPLLASDGNPAPGFVANLRDFGGFVEPLMRFAHKGDVQIGFGGALLPGRIPMDVMAVLLSKGYVAARLAWVGIAVLIAVAAGAIYRPHAARKQRTQKSRVARWLGAGPVPAAKVPWVVAGRSAHPLGGVLLAELKLTFPGRLSLLLGGLIAVSGLLLNYRHIVSPAILLLLIFGLTAQAARAEARGMLALSSTMSVSPGLRRGLFCIAGLVGALLLSVPALVVHGSWHALVLALAIGLGTAGFAMAVTMISRSAFAARLLLLIAWYVYISAK